MHGGSHDQSHDQPTGSSVSWQASEFIHHEKEMNWFLGVGAVGLLLVLGLAFFVDLISAVAVFMMAAAFLSYAGRKPRTLAYELSSDGLTIDRKNYPFSDFRSFSLREEGGFASVQLIPVKRFMPAIAIYFSHDDGPRILEVLTNHLPHEDRQPDIVDRLFERLRF